MAGEAVENATSGRPSRAQRRAMSRVSSCARVNSAPLVTCVLDTPAASTTASGCRPAIRARLVAMNLRPTIFIRYLRQR
jgi:formylglycine-generating enzyme required for sulfatase activity